MFDNREPDIRRTRVVALERLNNSRLGNPRFRVALADGSMRTTQSDASVNYGIQNPELRGDVDVWLSKAGRIVYMAPASD